MVERTAENVQILEKKPLYKGFFKADEYFLRYPRYDGTMSRTVSREVMERGHAAAVLLYDTEREKIVLVEQFRVGVYLTGENPWIAECVAGIIGQGETPEAVARREAVEESGCEVGEIIPICRYFSSPGGMSETLYVFCGQTDSSKCAVEAGLENEGEDTRVLVLDADEAIQALLDGKINNAVTIISLQWFMLNRRMLKEKWGRNKEGGL